jgi:ribonuclease Z
VLVLSLLQTRYVSAQLGAIAGPRKLEPGGPMQVILLGTGIPVPNPMRATAATLVIVGDKAMLVDTGRGCVVRLAEARIGNISAVLFTHYHSDHIAGFGDLLVARGIAGAENPLPVIGPPGAKRVVDGFRMAYSLDESYRAAHHGKYWGVQGTKMKVTEAEPGVVYTADGLKVTMFKVNHAPIDPAVGYRFDYQGKVVVVSGDTIKTAKMVEMSKDADVLVHEALDLKTIHRIQPMLKRADPRRAALLEDVLDNHASTTDVAEIARDARVKKLVLTHLFPSIPPQETAEKNFVRGMSEIYDGPIIVGRDGMTIDVE